MTLRGIKVCVFDAYGTLFDHASAVKRCPGIPDEIRDRLSALWRDKQLQYTWLRAAQGRHADFRQVTEDGLAFAMETVGLADAGLQDRLLGLYEVLDPFPEVPGVLRRLKEAGFKTAILSNGTPAMLDSAVASAQIGPFLDAVLSVEQAGAFKPHPSVYQLVLRHFSVDVAEVSFQSSNGWDAYAASAFGMHTVWCNRYGQRPERLPGRPDFEIPTLTPLPELLGAASP